MNTSLRLFLYSLWITLVFGVTVVEKWRYIDFDWLSEEQRQQYINDGRYVKSAVVPIDIFMGEETFLGIPRGDGVPAALVTLHRTKRGAGGPLVTPYPDWSWTGSDCDRSIISVYRMHYDDCGRLWVLDNGVITTANGSVQQCPPKILAFEPKSRRLLIRKEIPKEYAFNKQGIGMLVTPYVDILDKTCNNFMVYLADIYGFGLVMWNGKNEFKRVDSNVFAASRRNFTLNGDSFTLGDGVVGLAMSKCRHKDPQLYFSVLTSEKLYHVAAKELDVNYRKAPNYVEDKGDITFRKVSLVIHGTKMYFASLEDNELLEWDIRTSFTQQNLKILAKDNTVLQFVSGLKYGKQGSGPVTGIYGFSNRYQKTASGTRNISEYNYYAFRCEQRTKL